MLYTTTPAQRYQEECENDRLVQAHSSLERLRRAFDRFWADPIANAALLGTTAQAAFTIHGATGEYIAAIAPELIAEIPQIDTARWDLAWQGDGSLVVTPKLQQQEEE